MSQTGNLNLPEHRFFWIPAVSMPYFKSVMEKAKRQFVN